MTGLTRFFSSRRRAKSAPPSTNTETENKPKKRKWRPTYFKFPMILFHSNQTNQKKNEVNHGEGKGSDHSNQNAKQSKSTFEKELSRENTLFPQTELPASPQASPRSKPSVEIPHQDIIQMQTQTQTQTQTLQSQATQPEPKTQPEPQTQSEVIKQEQAELLQQGIGDNNSQSNNNNNNNNDNNNNKSHLTTGEFKKTDSDNLSSPSPELSSFATNEEPAIPFHKESSVEFESSNILEERKKMLKQHVRLKEEQVNAAISSASENIRSLQNSVRSLHSGRNSITTSTSAIVEPSGNENRKSRRFSTKFGVLPKIEIEKAEVFVREETAEGAKAINYLDDAQKFCDDLQSVTHSEEGTATTTTTPTTSEKTTPTTSSEPTTTTTTTGTATTVGE